MYCPYGEGRHTTTLARPPWARRTFIPCDIPSFLPSAYERLQTPSPQSVPRIPRSRRRLRASQGKLGTIHLVPPRARFLHVKPKGGVLCYAPFVVYTQPTLQLFAQYCTQWSPAASSYDIMRVMSMSSLLRRSPNTSRLHIHIGCRALAPAALQGDLSA